MNHNLSKLFSIAQKPERRIIGLMSGTSVDGLDIALCRFKGTGMDTEIELEKFTTIPYEQTYRDYIRAIFSKDLVELPLLTLLNGWIAHHHADMILSALKDWRVEKESVDLIASHGQTIYHAPSSQHRRPGFQHATLQLGDGDHMAVKTGLITLSDFRQKHIAAGGEGAPLAAYGDYLIFSRLGENRIMLNIGGIANFTFLPGDLQADRVFCSDTGPGNTLMDAYIQKHFPGKRFDEHAELAKKGTVIPALLSALANHPFFSLDFPKTTGPELFNLKYLEEALQRCSISEVKQEDVLATLNRFSAVTIAEAIRRVAQPLDQYKFYVSGGGMHNPLLLENLESLLPDVVFEDTGSLRIHPDAKEAVLFAVLANECICGGAVHFGSGRNGIPNVSMGKISFPF